MHGPGRHLHFPRQSNPSEKDHDAWGARVSATVFAACAAKGTASGARVWVIASKPATHAAATSIAAGVAVANCFTPLASTAQTMLPPLPQRGDRAAETTDPRTMPRVGIGQLDRTAPCSWSAAKRTTGSRYAVNTKHRIDNRTARHDARQVPICLPTAKSTKNGPIHCSEIHRTAGRRTVVTCPDRAHGGGQRTGLQPTPR